MKVLALPIEMVSYRGIGGNGTQNSYKRVKKWILNLNICFTIDKKYLVIAY
jgi:hypothetical protein